MGWLLPAPGGNVKISTPRDRCPGHSSYRNCKQKFSICYRFRNLVPPVFALTFCQNFVEKFPFSSPLPGAHHVWNLSGPPQAVPPKKFGLPRSPHGGDTGGQSFDFPPSPLNFPSSEISMRPPTGRARPRLQSPRFW